MIISYNFEWDSIKARDNRDKHAVTFDEAATVFRDPKALSIFDPDHSETEDRWILRVFRRRESYWSWSIPFEKRVKVLSRSELFQAGKQQNKKSKHMVNEHEKRV